MSCETGQSRLHSVLEARSVQRDAEDKLARVEREIHEPFIELSREIRQLGVLRIEHLQHAPTSLEFSRYVGSNQPVLIDEATKDWRAHTRWSNRELLQRMQKRHVSVAVTPNGAADAIDRVHNVFALPCEEQWAFDDFLHELTSATSTASPVVYAQQQNSSLTTEFAALHDDIDEFDWASEAFDCKADAVNIWIGGNRSVTSPHCDFYENIYSVIRGSKHFLLWPPADLYFLNRRRVKQARWTRQNDQSLSLCNQPDAEEIHWLDIDARKEWNLHSRDTPLHLKPFDEDIDFEENEVFDNQLPIPVSLRADCAPPLCLTVRPGQTLYLPSQWTHAVLQQVDEEGVCIAVNSWFDMKFDARFAQQQFLIKQVDAAYQKIFELRLEHKAASASAADTK